MAQKKREIKKTQHPPKSLKTPLNTKVLEGVLLVKHYPNTPPNTHHNTTSRHPPTSVNVLSQYSDSQGVVSGVVLGVVFGKHPPSCNPSVYRHSERLGVVLPSILIYLRHETEPTKPPLCRKQTTTLDGAKSHFKRTKVPRCLRYGEPTIFQEHKSS